MGERIAVIGDVHGNLAALDAVLRAVADAGIPRGVCTGDLVMRGADPEECVQRLIRVGWPCVQGNTDLKVIDEPPRPLDHPASLRPGSRSWSLRRMSERSLRYLAGLPDHVTLKVGGRRVLVVHGQPLGKRPAVDEDTRGRHLLAIARRYGADCIVAGHTHRPFVRRVSGLLVVNPGSVGEGAPDDRRPAWAWIESGKKRLSAHLERVPEEVALVRDRSISTA